MVAVDARRAAVRPRSDGGRSSRAAHRWADIGPPILVALLAWALMLPSAARVVQLSPDMVEYVDVARRVVNGEGYVLGIKAYHIGGPAVVHDGLLHRTPLFTLMMDASDPEHAGTDYTLLASIVLLVGYAANFAGAAIADAFGYAAAWMTAAALLAVTLRPGPPGTAPGA